MTGSDLQPDRLALLGDLADRFGLDAIYLFGSRAKEVSAFLRSKRRLDSAARSDVDVGVMPAPGQRLSVRDKVRLAIALEEMWDVNQVDLVVLPQASPFLAVDIVAGERVYTRDAYTMDEYELYVLRRAGDLEPFERERRRRLLWEKHP